MRVNKEITLIDFKRSGERHRLFSDGLDVSNVAMIHDSTKPSRARGYGQIRRTGFPSRRRSLVGLFSNDGKIWLTVDDRVYDVTPSDTTVRREQGFWPFQFRFQVSEHDSSILTVDYPLFDSGRVFPWSTDIFQWITEQLADEHQKRRFILFWEAVGEGHEPEEEGFIQELEQAIERSSDRPASPP